MPALVDSKAMMVVGMGWTLKMEGKVLSATSLQHNFDSHTTKKKNCSERSEQ